MSARSTIGRALSVAALALAAMGSSGCPQTAAPSASDAESAAALQHWRSLEPERQGELERRYDELHELPEPERAALVEKKRELDLELERTRAGLAAGERERFDALSPHEQRTVLRELVLAQRRERGLLRRADVPSHFLRELEIAPPQERQRRFRELRDRLRDQAPEQALRRLGEKLGRDPAAIDGALRAPPHERIRILRSWRREQLVREFERRGLPPFLERAEWDELGKLDDDAFWREFERRRPREPWREPGRGGPPERREAHDAREPRGDREFRGEREPGSPRESGGLPRRGPPPHEWRGPEDGPPLRPTFDDLLELRGLPPAERHEAIGERVRARALQWFESRRALDPARLAELKQLHGEAFFERLRSLLRDARKPV